MPTFWERHRPQLVSGVVGLAVGALVVGGIWAANALGPGGGGDEAGATTASRPTPSASPRATPRLGPLDDAAGGATPSAGATGATAASCGRSTARVSSAAQLTSALSAARAGDVIALADGTYTGTFEATATGTADRPIALCGGSGAVLDGGDPSDGYVLHLDGAAYWTLSGFTVQNGQKGVVFDQTTHSTIRGVTVQHIGDEAVHLRADSTDNTVTDTTVSDTGLRKPQFGEGIYVGSSKNNWCAVTDCQPDRSDRNVVTGNTISRTAAENVDIKEGTTGGVLSDNSFDGSGMQGQNHADSWVDVKGNDWTVTGNRGVHSILDGFQTHELEDGWGTDNTFADNTVDLGNTTGVAFALRPVLGNTVSCDNRVIGSNELSTTKCTR